MDRQSEKTFRLLILPVLVTIFSTYGIFFFHTQDDIWDIYSPLNGISRQEEKALSRFEYASGSHHYRMQILATRKDGGNMLSVEALDELSQAHKFVSDNITAIAYISNGTDSQTIKMQYREMCGVYCKDSNAAILALLQTVAETRTAAMPEGNSLIHLTYPNVEAFHTRVYVGYSLGDLTFSAATPPIVTEAHLFILHYMVDLSLPGGRALADDMEQKLLQLFHGLSNVSPNLNYAMLSRNREMKEQREITLVALPFLGLTVGVLVIFMLCTLIDFPLHHSQHFEAIIGVLSPGMALYTTAGILWGAGYPFSNILTVVPFLVVTIGIDDAFLILAGWRHSTPSASIEQRMGESVQISGASVTVTSVTDVLCFSIGLFSNLPVVRLFCLYTTVALFIDFVYQADDTSSIEKWKAKLKESSVSFFGFIPKGESSEGSTTPSSVDHKTSLEVFIDYLHTWPMKSLILLIFFTHIAVCVWLARMVNTSFDMENLYLKYSPLTEISRTMQNHVLKEAFTVNFGVYPMPDFSKENVREKFEEMLMKLESIPGFTDGGKDSTNVWTREYENAIAFWGEGEDFWTTKELINNYREYDLDEKYITIGKDADGDEVIDGFFFIITYKHFKSFLEVQELMDIRLFFMFHVYRSRHKHVSAIILMSLLILVFVMNVEAIISVVLSILSICLGTVSYLHLWGVNLDAVALISTLMSIGFSVDYSAHVCYHYFAHASQQIQDSKTVAIEMGGGLRRSSADEYETRLESSKSRLLFTFKGIGWPVLQSGLSTLMGMIPLVFVKAYVVAVFWKTIILVSILGMLHALLLLPIIFIVTDDIKAFLRWCRSRDRMKPGTTQISISA